MHLVKIIQVLVLTGFILVLSACADHKKEDITSGEIDDLLAQMTLAEKVGQMSLMQSPGGDIPADFFAGIANGNTGSVLNETRPEVIREMQRVAVEESRLGIPLLFGRDIIHGFKTIFPINIGLAATFNPGLVQYTAEVAASEATSTGLNWNFAPMVDISRDPRWGRMAESFGEDPFLVSKMGLAMMQGFQGENLRFSHTMAACAKHFAGYGASEGGRDYNTTNIADVELWNTHFIPFKVLADAGIATFMTGFNDLSGIPSTGNIFLFRDILKERWKYEGFVVSDWASIVEMKAHGFAADDQEAALKAMLAGVDMEMASRAYHDHLSGLIEAGLVREKLLDDAVRRILKVKLDLGLFDSPYADLNQVIESPPEHHLEAAKKAAVQSFVLLKNPNNVLPLDEDIAKVAVIGPMADDRYEQLGTWIFDGDTNLSITPLRAFYDLLGMERVLFARGVQTTRSLGKEGIAKAIETAKQADVALIFAGEESILTGEAHSRAHLDLPGAQNELIKEVSKTGKPVVLIVMTPRPLTIGEISAYVDAVLYAWHPGTMAGPALADVIFGIESPSGKLPVTFPKAAGQIPIYYAHKNTGRPAEPDNIIAMEGIPVRSFQTSLGNTSHYLDIGFKPLFPFGFGLSYTTFEYDGLNLSAEHIGTEDTLAISVTLTNIGAFEAEEVTQLYVRDLVASITRPVKELKGFTRTRLMPGESKRIVFILQSQQLGFYDHNGNFLIEPGDFQLWIGGSSEATLHSFFTLNL